MLAQFLLKYNFRFPPEVTSLPEKAVFNGSQMPNMKANLIFSERLPVSPWVVRSTL